MTKLFTDKVIEYFKTLPRKPRFTDYIFPVEITAEQIAKHFGTSKVSVLNKMKEMERDNVVISKRGHVEGKPAKQLVFFLREDLMGAGGCPPNIDGSVPVRQVGHRELVFLKIGKLAEILNIKGDGRTTYDYRIRNCSSERMFEIPLPKVSYDLYSEKSVYESLEKVEVDGKQIPYSPDSIIHFKGTRSGKSGLGGGVDQMVPGNQHKEVVYVIPVPKGLGPDESVDIKLAVRVPGVFSNLLHFEYMASCILENTMVATIDVIPPKGYKIKQLKKFEGIEYKHGLYIIDAFTETRKTDLEDAVRKPVAEDRRLFWKIERPIIGYRYGLPFVVKK
jgi:hypothetical protein